ncbi:uncharacterized protein LOC110860470 [Folsomia candida]|uniref:Uncharacterized protein n=1 Tax=Folsomia candida TaxID=158441 RepID=A0A226F0F5_FOLCA|nr:uncharacterized protein LOC110860470 [Folsomia candida]OXA62968.1 hypothetical protein Fcan01_02002 [Folsomia candida]
MGAPYITAIAAIAGISAICSILSICGTGWVIGTQLVNLNGKLESMGLPNPKQYNECTRIYKDNDCTSYVELVADIEVRRSKIRLILITSCAIAILAVFFQLSVSLLVFFSDLKSIRRRARLWMIFHFVIAWVLLLCILSVYLTRTGYDMGIESSSELVQNLENVVSIMEPTKNFSSLSTFLKISLPLFYTAVSSNLICVSILFFMGIFVLQKYNEYESH